MKYAVEMGSGALMYMPSFIKIGSGIQKLIGGRHIQTHELMGEIYENAAEMGSGAMIHVPSLIGIE
jgi:hypothetical protein